MPGWRLVQVAATVTSFLSSLIDTLEPPLLTVCEASHLSIGKVLSTPSLNLAVTPTTRVGRGSCLSVFKGRPTSRTIDQPQAKMDATPRETDAQNEGTRINVSVWTLVGFSACFLCLRIYCKFLRHRRLWWDDYILIVSWVCSLRLRHSGCQNA